MDRPLQRTVAFALVLPWLVLGCYVPWNGERFARSFHLDHASASLSPELATTLAVLSMPHVFYFLVWTNASAFARLCRALHLGEPFKVFAWGAHLIKVAQLAALLRFFHFVPPSSVEDMSHRLLRFLLSLDPFQLLLGVELIAMGQVLNAGVYSAIGEAGVYYGTRLGVKVPWVTGFPFTVAPHPQYFGATLSFWGALLLLNTADAAQRGLFVIALAMVVFYSFSSYVEQEL